MTQNDKDIDFEVLARKLRAIVDSPDFDSERFAKWQALATLSDKHDSGMIGWFRRAPTFDFERFAERQQALAEQNEKLAKRRDTMPRISEALLALMAPRGLADAIIGDAEEQYHANVERFGAGKARRLYRIDVLKSVLPIAWTAFRRLTIFALIARLF